MKQVIRLTESDLHKIIKESVKRILREDTTFDNHIAERIFDDMVQKGLYNRVNNQMYVDWIMDSYGLGSNQRDVAEKVATKLDLYRMAMDDQYGAMSVGSVHGLKEANWSNALRDPGDYDTLDDEDFDDWDSDPLDNWKRDKEDGLI